MEIDHIGIAVKSIQDALPRFKALIDASSVEHLEVPEQKVRIAMLQLKNCRIELLEATGEDGPIGRFIKNRGEGIHHIAVKTKDIDAHIKRAEKAGFVTTGQVTRGAHGSLVAFIHPKSLSGVLLEFCEYCGKKVKD